MFARAIVVVLAVAGAAVAAPAGPALAADQCICIVSNKLRGGATPVKFQYRTCFHNGSCNNWKSRSFQVLQGAYTAKVICSVNPQFSYFQARFDWSYRPGYQHRGVNLRRFQSFNVPSDRIASCGCMPSAQYRFVKGPSGVNLLNGAPSDMVRGACRFNKL